MVNLPNHHHLQLRHYQCQPSFCYSGNFPIGVLQEIGKPYKETEEGIGIFVTGNTWVVSLPTNISSKSSNALFSFSK